MKLKNTAIFLTLGLLAACLTGCGGEKEPSVSITDGTTEVQAGETKETVQEMGKHHITVETVEISLSDLKAQDYTVPVYIELVNNAGITYSEWGAIVDDRCTFTADTKDETGMPLPFQVYFSINDAKHFIWTAWASGGAVNTYPGRLLRLDVTVPQDAAAGDFYTVDYADWSLADKGHAWSSEDADWAESDDVTWIDGGIRVVE